MDFLSTLIAGGTQAASAYANYQGQKETNETNIEMSREAREFNREEAQKTRDYQERMRATQFTPSNIVALPFEPPRASVSAARKRNEWRSMPSSMPAPIHSLIVATKKAICVDSRMSRSMPAFARSVSPIRNSSERPRRKASNSIASL